MSKTVRVLSIGLVLAFSMVAIVAAGHAAGRHDLTAFVVYMTVAVFWFIILFVAITDMVIRWNAKQMTKEEFQFYLDQEHERKKSTKREESRITTGE